MAQLVERSTFSSERSVLVGFKPRHAEMFFQLKNCDLINCDLKIGKIFCRELICRDDSLTTARHSRESEVVSGVPVRMYTGHLCARYGSRLTRYASFPT